MPNDERDITLKDVVMHMHHMEQRLSTKIDANTSAIAENKEEIRRTRKELTERIDALDEDLVATIQDTVKIRRHVGIAVAEE